MAVSCKVQNLDPLEGESRFKKGFTEVVPSELGLEGCEGK